jgi:hypothetical protein
MKIKGIKPPRRNGRPIGKKWDKAKLVSLNIPPIVPFVYERGYVGYYFVWVIEGRKWVYIKKPQSTKLETPKQLKMLVTEYDKMVKSRLTSDYLRRHGGNEGFKIICNPLPQKPKTNPKNQEI